MSISPSAHLKAIEERLRADGFELTQDSVANIPAMIGRTKEFRLAWLATQQKIFIVAGATDQVSEETIDSFSKAAMEYALKHNEGLPRGVQAGVACFSLLVAPSVDKKAKAWVMNRPKKHFAAFEMPCCFETSTNTLHYYQKTPIWGAIYYKSFRKIISRYFSP